MCRTDSQSGGRELSRLKRATFLCVALLMLTVSSEAFDGQRKGFVLGVGAGLAASYISSENSLEERSIWRAGPGASSFIGYAPDNTTVVFFGGKAAWSYLERISNKYESYFDTMEEDSFKGLMATFGSPIILPFLWIVGTHATFGFVGVTHYLNENAPSFFVEGTIGLGIVPDELSERVCGGFGISAAGGYEFSPHYSIRCDLLYGSASGSYSNSGVFGYKDKTQALSVMLSVSAMAY